MTPLADRRAFRKRVTEAAAQRRPKSVARPAPPSGVTLAYTQILRDASRAMDATIMSALRAEGLVRADAVKDLAPELSRGDLAALVAKITRKVHAIASYSSLVGQIDKVATRLVDRSRAEWRRQLRGSLGIDLTADPDLTKLVDRFRGRQGDLIVSLARDKVARVKSVLAEVGSDARVETIQQRIVEETGATESRAALIARTETTTFNAQLAQARHEAAGITAFKWSTSRDERVRMSHRALEGRTFEYARPPLVDGQPTLPGATYNCRCVAIPELPDLGA